MSGPEGIRRDKERLLYHRFAWAYDQVVDQPGGPHLDAVAHVLTAYGSGPGSTIVDAGCGTGSYAVGLAARGWRMIAVDRAQELVELASERAAERAIVVELACGDFTAGWGPGHPVDGVLCRGVLNDLITDDERRGALMAFAEWLAPRGVLVADVRESAATKQRYEGGRRLVRTARRGGDHLTFTSDTTMTPESDRLRVIERWKGVVRGAQVRETNEFEMRCWTKDDLERWRSLPVSMS